MALAAIQNLGKAKWRLWAASEGRCIVKAIFTRSGLCGGLFVSVFVVFLLCISFHATAGQAAQASAPRASAAKPAAIGTPAPDFNLAGVDGKNHRLSDFASAKVLALVMEDDHSPASQLYEGRIGKLYEEYKDKSVALVAISPDSPDAVPIDQMAYTDVGDRLEDMKTTAAYRHIDWPYLYDGDKQSVATELGATVTPEIFIFDQARKLQYRGRIDDNLDASKVTSRDAESAIDALLAGKPVPDATTEATGTPIYWASEKAAAQADLTKMEADPLNVSLASKDELGKLRNNPTGKYLLVNFWATWCGPCVGEFPDLQDTYRMYGGRDFTFVTVSENDPTEKADVLDFLEKQHASTPQNLLFSESDVYAMQAAFDPNMPGAVPVTLFFAPNADVIYEQVGDLDTMKLRHAILANLPDSQEYPGEQKYWSSLMPADPKN
ncbi:MAG TPA: redoxin domain-containing protein [Candidatus Aquilonibacter sp.]|nr:redoxin domain-containing protein [Candidatus Aquilonibacter sp.]